MIQTGDPSGSGKGGQSIYGAPFADEIRSTLKVWPLYLRVNDHGIDSTHCPVQHPWNCRHGELGPGYQ